MSRKNISQPPEWWLAFQTEADKHGQSLSEWIGDCCWANLPKTVAAKLPERPAAHRPGVSCENSKGEE